MARENKEGFEPSNPQMSMGNNIAAVLPQLESRLFPTMTVDTLPSMVIPVKPAAPSIVHRLSDAARRALTKHHDAPATTSQPSTPPAKHSTVATVAVAH